MAKFPERRNTDEDTTSWLYTALGMGIILCVVGFIGFAQPSSVQTVAAKNSLEVPKYQAPEQTKVDLPDESQNLANLTESIAAKKALPPVIELPKFPDNVLEDPGLFVSLPFGGDAKERCVSTCDSDSLCLQSCARLLPDNFARRILPQDLNHKKLATQSVESCKNASFINPIAGAKRAEVKAFLVPVEYFEEGEVSRKLAEVRGAMQNLTNTKVTDPLAEAVCYYQGALVSAMATAKAAKGRDSVSELAYREYESMFALELQKKLQEIRG